MAPPLFLHLSKAILLFGLGVLAILFLLSLLFGRRAKQKKWPFATGSLILAVFFLSYGSWALWRTWSPRGSHAARESNQSVLESDVIRLEQDLSMFMTLEENRRLLSPAPLPPESSTAWNDLKLRLFAPGAWSELEGEPWERFRKAWLSHPVDSRRILSKENTVQWIRSGPAAPMAAITCRRYSNELKISSLETGND